jgi:hypothetical protein
MILGRRQNEHVSSRSQAEERRKKQRDRYYENLTTGKWIKGDQFVSLSWQVVFLQSVFSSIKFLPRF